MGYKVTKDGEIICETVEDALALQAKILGHKSDGPQGKGLGHYDESPGSAWTDSRYREFMGYMKGNQKTLLNFLFAQEHPKSDKSIRQNLGISSNLELSGITAGLVKNAKKAGIAAKDLFIREIRNLGDERIAEYRLADGFRSIAQRLGGLEK
jgi:hypothetical protein